MRELSLRGDEHLGSALVPLPVVPRWKWIAPLWIGGPGQPATLAPPRAAQESSGRRERAKRISCLLRAAIDCRWAGLYEVMAGQVVNLAWDGLYRGIRFERCDQMAARS